MTIAEQMVSRRADEAACREAGGHVVLVDRGRRKVSFADHSAVILRGAECALALEPFDEDCACPAGGAHDEECPGAQAAEEDEAVA